LADPGWREHDADIDSVEVLDKILEQHPEDTVLGRPVVDLNIV
jgi:hypothetical protein